MNTRPVDISLLTPMHPGYYFESSVKEKPIAISNWENTFILIVEDDQSSFKFLEAILKKTNASILHATNGQDALELCKTNPAIDIVLMDIQLPIMDGLKATKEIKKFRKNLPIIAQTAHAMEDDRKLCIKAGCDDYIAKPINKNHLLSILNKYL